MEYLNEENKDKIKINKIDEDILEKEKREIK